MGQQKRSRRGWRGGWEYVRAVVAIVALSAAVTMSANAQDKDDEIVATLTGGRVIVHATHESVTFVAIDEPIESGSASPRVMNLDTHHVAVLFGSTEWRVPADPNAIRLDRGRIDASGIDMRYSTTYNGEAEPDLETMGVAFLEKLTPLAARLHHKLDFPPDQALFEMVMIGFGPGDYGPEVWTVEYRMTQAVVATRGDYWQTKVLRPRFTQLYPPDKKAPHTLVEACYPECKGPTLQQLLEGNEPGLEKLAKSDAKMLKAVELISKGQAQKAAAPDAVSFLRAAVPLIYTGQRFVMGTFEEQHGFDWIVPPEEPIEKAKKDDKNAPAQPPTLRRRVEVPN